MKYLDNDWKIPDGFEARKNYRNDPERGETVVGEAMLLLEGEGQRWPFWVGEHHENVPALPLRDHGELWSTGWDIPTRWAIDAAGECYMDNAHGHPLQKTSREGLVAACETDDERRQMQARVGMPVDIPEWQKLALAAGWTPPK